MKRTVKTTWLAALVVALAGCDLLGAGLTSSQGSCTVSADKHCTDYSGLQPATGALAKSICDEAKGTFKDNAKCDPTGSIGGCNRSEEGDPVKIEWSYPGDVFYAGTTLQTPDDLLDKCSGRYVDAARKEWSSDAGLPEMCTIVAGAPSAVSFKNVAPVRVRLYHCDATGSIGQLGQVDAGTTFRLSPAVTGDAVWVAIGSYLMKTVVVSASDTTVEVP